MNLNPEQLKAVEHAGGPLLVVAGAGSGKTRVIVHRIAHLIEKHKVHPSNILAVTFTNKAAGEMRGRLEAMLGSAARELWIATFHAACLRILRRHSADAGYGPYFQIFDEAQQLSLIKDCIKELNISGRLIVPESALNCISRAKDICKGPEEFEAAADNFYKRKLAEVYALYQRRLVEIQAMDFGDLIRLTVELFEKKPEILSIYQRRFAHVLVDEYQDTNHAQYRLIENIVRGHKNICVVGDEDQSIYRWRGADISNILRFEKDFPGATTIRLEQNYRSTKTIIEAAGSVIANNSERKPKTLWTENPEGAPIKIISCHTEREEAEAVAGEIRALKEKGHRLSGIAVFYRTNAQSRPFEDVFLQEGIPHRIFGGIRFYERMEVKDIIAYLRLIAEPKDDVSFARIVNVPARGISRETVARLRQFASEKGVSLFEGIRDFARTDLIRPAAAKKLLQFYNMMENLREGALKKPLPELIQETLEKTGYVEALVLKNTMEAEDRLENINELVSAAEEFMSDNTARAEPVEARTIPHPASPPLIQFLDQAALVSDIDGLDENADSITLMTVHLAKGLEFDVVFMAGMEEGLFPHGKSIEDPEELEEERRLCYVGMTRARKLLFMSHAFRRRLFGTTRYGVVSRFIDEIPMDLKEVRSQKSEVRSQSSECLASDFWRLTSDFDQRPFEEREAAFPIGSLVSHPIFGAGYVKKCERTHQGHKVTVQFANGALKRLIAERAGLISSNNCP
jgi:DNA helicase-2/ATP-dependent DNA helicase PcrA